MNAEFELILTTESKIVSTNLNTFEEQANHYLASLTQTFETDDDFARAKEESKALKAIEDKIRAAIKNTQNGEIAALITTAEQIAERFREERISREKLVKTKETEVKQRIAEEALAEISATRDQLAKPSDISLALEITLPKSHIAQRISEAQKTKRTLDTLTKAVNTEKGLIVTEIATEVARLKQRLDQLNAKSAWLFPDAVKLIASQEDLAPIITERIEAEQQREAELKAKATQDAQGKAETEKVQAEAHAIADEIDQQAVNSAQNLANANNTAPSEDFIITIRLNNVTQEHAIATARGLKAQFEHVSLNKAK